MISLSRKAARDERVRQGILAWRLARLREAVPALGVTVLVLVVMGWLVWLSATHQRMPRGDGLYCTEHDGGEICTKAPPRR